MHRIICLLLLAGNLAVANTDIRDWTLPSIEKIRGELVSYNPETGEVVLKLNFKEDRIYHFDDFSTLDRAWLIEWSEFEQILEDQLLESKGRFEHIVTSGNFPTDLYVYYPSAQATSEQPLPALILFHPGGKGARFMLRHMEAAEATSLILISCGQFRNSHKEEEEKPMADRWKEVFPQILEKVKLDRQRIFMGGTSGGASRAFDFSSTTPYPWAGIYSAGGWLGGRSEYDKPFAENMRVVMVNGSNDKGANAWIDSDSEVLKTRNCVVAVVAFEGGHQVPPPQTQKKAFSWLLSSESFIEVQ